MHFGTLVWEIAGGAIFNGLILKLELSSGAPVWSAPRDRLGAWLSVEHLPSKSWFLL